MAATRKSPSKSRRSRAKSPAKPTGETFPGNVVVSRRLAFLPDAEYARAAKDFSEGASISALVEKYDFRTSARAAYGIEQKLVADGTVAPISPDDAEAVRTAKEAGDSMPRLCARTGLTPARVKDLLAAE